MNIEKLDKENIYDADFVDEVKKLLALEGLKKIINGKSVADYFMEIKLDPHQWRTVAAEFLKTSWELSELDQEDVRILEEMREMLRV
jgi:hypothetical protein